MKLFSSDKELTERISALESDLTAANETASRVPELEKELAELRAGFDAERAELQNQLNFASDALESSKVTIAELEAAKLELTAAAELTAEKVSLEAARQLAASGHPPVEGVSGEQDKPDPYAGKSKQELESIAHGIRNPKEQSAFVTKYLRPLVGNQSNQ